MKNSAPKAITVKLYTESTSNKTKPLTKALKEISENPHNSIYIKKDITKKALEASLKKAGLNNFEVREGITGGCFGGRDGKSYKGYTLYIGLDEISSEFIDEDNDTVYNVWTRLDEATTEVIEMIAEDEYENIYDEYPLESGNTCNSECHDYNREEETDENGYAPLAVPLVHVQYRFVHDTETDKTIALVQFHCGGDIRGNYSSWYKVILDDPSDLMCALYY